MGGWAIIVADILVMANLAQIAGLYSFLLVGWQAAADSVLAVTIVGVVWIAVMTAICYIGIELSARTQVGLLGAEVLTLAAFVVVALVKVYSGDGLETSLHPSLSWINPFEISSFSALVSGVLLGIFIYWGWDSTVAVNEESKDPTEGPGKAAVLATVILLLIYVFVSVAAQAFAGPKELIDNADDVLSALAPRCSARRGTRSSSSRSSPRPRRPRRRRSCPPPARRCRWPTPRRCPACSARSSRST